MAQSLKIEQAIGQKLLLAFRGKDRPSDEIIRALREYRAGGITLFRAFNIDRPSQVRQLAEQLQSLARDLNLPPLLMGLDQEGGQLMAVGEGTTPLPGNMALGATGSVELARRAGEVLGHELAAMGINFGYAPCVDVNINPDNPVIGIRSFGEDPVQVSKLAVGDDRGDPIPGRGGDGRAFPRPRRYGQQFASRGSVGSTCIGKAANRGVSAISGRHKSRGSGRYDGAPGAAFGRWPGGRAHDIIQKHCS